jgi:imidazoleglycerol-phosphate dehydratase
MERTATVERKTTETKIRVGLSLGGGSVAIRTPDGFFTHLLEALARHGGWGIDLEAEGDSHVDLHHTVEDVGIVLGQALSRALGERRGIARFGWAYAPLDEALVRAVVDFSGRGRAFVDLGADREKEWVTSSFPLGLLVDFLEGFASHGQFTLHLDVLRGRSAHHVAEAGFKALALALRDASRIRPESAQEIPSTKGTLLA